MYNMCISYVYLICKHIKVLDLQIYRGDLEAPAQWSFRRNAAVVTSSARPGRPGRVCTSPSPDTSWGLERCDRVKPLMYWKSMRCMWCMWCVWWRNVISEEFKWNGWSSQIVDILHSTSRLARRASSTESSTAPSVAKWAGLVVPRCQHRHRLHHRLPGKMIRPLFSAQAPIISKPFKYHLSTI